MSVITESHIQKFKSLHTNIDSFLKLSKEKQSLRNNQGNTVPGKEEDMKKVNGKMINIIENIKNHFETDDLDYFAAIFAWGKNKKERMMGKPPYNKVMNWNSDMIKGIHIEDLKKDILTIEDIEEEFELDKQIRMEKVKRLKAKYLPAGFDWRKKGGRRRTRGKKRTKSRKKRRKSRRKKRRRKKRTKRRR